MTHVFPIQNAGLDMLYDWHLLQKEVNTSLRSEVGITCFMCSSFAGVLGCIPHSSVENSKRYFHPNS